MRDLTGSVLDRPQSPSETPPPEVAEASATLSLGLLDGFRLHIQGEPALLGVNEQRLIAFVALRERPVKRAEAAGTLWRSSVEHRAQASLRSALWRVGKLAAGLIDATRNELRLGRTVDVDVRRMSDAASTVHDSDARDLHIVFDGVLLPGWYDDWLIVERERLRSLQLRALSVLGDRRRIAGRLDEAEAACRAGVAIEPLRESLQRALIAVLLSRGERAEAVRTYRTLCDMLQEELGVDPSEETQALVAEGPRDDSVTLLA